MAMNRRTRRPRGVACLTRLFAARDSEEDKTYANSISFHGDGSDGKGSDGKGSDETDARTEMLRELSVTATQIL